jgi:uncharacterized protein
VHRIFELIDADDADGVRELLRREPAAAAARDDQGLSALMRAAYRRGDVFAVVRDAGPLLDPFDRIVAGERDGLSAPDAWTVDGFTGLHLAAFAGNVEAARALLEAGADPNAVSRASFAQVTPLGTAAFAGSADVARVLLEHGADPSITGGSEVTPLEVARANEDAALVELLTGPA